ncbi:MAG: altronate hydrolase [Verrucomicrobiales bacterium]|jgi:altronate hydrolase
MVKALRVHPQDNIIVALRDLSANDTVEVGGQNYTLKEDIAAKHKFADRDLAQGDTVTMYGLTVGKADTAIPSGGRISTENVTHAVQPAHVNEQAPSWTPPDVSHWADTMFEGYHRANGSVGTANQWLVIPLVFCENRNLMLMKEALLGPLGYGLSSPYEQYLQQLVRAQAAGGSMPEIEPETEGASPTAARLFPNVDGVKFLSHTMGCGGTDRDCDSLAGLLAGYIAHPNVAGATILSLGCQKTQLDQIQEEIHQRDPSYSKPLHFFEQQKSQSERQMLGSAIRATFSGMAEANELRRAPAPLSKLVLGVECGGSDGFSGISANPVIGLISNLLAALKGSIILSEFPELCGAEQNLVDRCATPELGQRFLELMAAYQSAAQKVGSGFDQNPSHGNIADGLITDAMKSAGAARKGGSSPVNDVLDYPGWATQSGLNLLCSPGNDVESTTAMAGAGANIMIFSTGLGTPTGNPVTPVIKISSNSTIAEKLSDIVDFDTGPIIAGERTLESLADDLFQMVIDTASGRYMTCAQRLGQDDFIPWKRGVSL